jgi:pimeloyl-ACP methyl ester carboxylesterase
VAAAPRLLIFRRPLADLWLRPWFDWLGLRFVHRFYFPVSRGWAKAAEAGCTAAVFRETFALPSSACPGVERAIARVLAAERRHASRLWQWQNAFFGGQELSPQGLASIEIERSQAAHRFMALRRLFGRLRRRLPAAAWDIAGPGEVLRCHGARLAQPEAAYPFPPATDLMASCAAAAAWGSLRWLSFVSPVLGDRVAARVEEPARCRPDAPTLVLLHGIAMEDEMWRPRPDPFAGLRDAGWRLVKPEGPWHGRRRPEGRYGGEPVIARGLDGFLTLFQAWVAETAVLLRWARAQGGPVALAGISLGALTAQLLASEARRWPAALAPDALLLIGTSGCLRRAAYDGALARALGMPARLAEAGWTETGLEPWIGLIEPGESAVPPERVVLLLGRKDRVTPFDGGLLLAKRWRVPPENLFQPCRGHFSAALGLSAFPAPIERLREVTESVASAS